MNLLASVALVMGTLTPSAPASWILGPEAAGVAQGLAVQAARALGGHPEDVRIARDHLRFTVAARGAASVTLDLAHAPPGDDCVPLLTGDSLCLVAGRVSPAVLLLLSDVIVSDAAALPWRRVVPKTAPVRELAPAPSEALSPSASSPPASTPHEAPQPSWPLPVGAGLLLAVGVVLPKRHAVRAGAATLLLAGLAAWFAVDGARAPPVSAPKLPDEVLRLKPPPRCRREPFRWTAQGWGAALRCDGHNAVVGFVPHGRGRVWAGPRPLGDGPRSFALALEDLGVEAAARGFPFTARPSPPSTGLEGLGASERGEVALAAALAAAGAVAFFWFFVGALRTLVRGDGGLGSAKDRAMLLGALGVAIILPLLLPARMVLVYTGYDLTAQLALLKDLPRYGAGGVWLYDWAFTLWGGPDPQAIQLANRLYSALTPVAVATLGLALAPRKLARRAAASAVVLWIVAPVFWRLAASEALQPGATLLLLSGLAGVGLVARGWATSAALIPAGFLLALAGVTRPEVLVAGPVWVVTTAWQASRRGEGRWDARRVTAWVAVALGFMLLLFPHGIWLLHDYAAHTQAGDVAGPAEGLSRAAQTLLFRDLFLWPRWVTPALLAWLALAGRLTRSWGPPLGAAFGAAAWVVVTGVDLPLVSVPRVQAPPVAVLIPWAAVGLAALHERAPRVNGALVLLALTGLVWGGPLALARRPADAEEALIRAARGALQPGVCVATIGFEDPPPVWKTQRQFPDYLFRGHPVMGLGGFTRAWGDECGPGSLVVLGTRCYMALRKSWSAPAPPPPGRLVACTRFAEAFRLEPVVERTIPTQPDDGFPSFPAASTLRVGVYTVTGRAHPHAPANAR